MLQGGSRWIDIEELVVDLLYCLVVLRNLHLPFRNFKFVPFRSYRSLPRKSTSPREYPTRVNARYEKGVLRC